MGNAKKGGVERGKEREGGTRYVRLADKMELGKRKKAKEERKERMKGRREGVRGREKKNTMLAEDGK